MKIRNGFVSNSSSSSFVVAFPRKPETEMDIISMVFNDQPNAIFSVYDGGGMNAAELSAVILKDVIDAGEAKDIDVARALTNRYYYWTGDVGHFVDDDGELQPLKGWAGNDKGSHFGVDKDALNDLAQVNIEEEAHRKQFHDGIAQCRRKIADRMGIKDSYDNRVDKAFREDKKWRKVEQKYWEVERELWEKKSDITDKVARADAQKFIEDNKDAYVVVLEYGDDYSVGCILEHGDVWDNIKHIKVSNH